jgi:hypothetical protein
MTVISTFERGCATNTQRVALSTGNHLIQEAEEKQAAAHTTNLDELSCHFTISCIGDVLRCRRFVSVGFPFGQRRTRRRPTAIGGFFLVKVKA